MQVQVNIEFDQLVQAVKSLPPNQLKQLLSKIENQAEKSLPEMDLEDLLLKGPVATEKQMAVIENNRKAINQWRNK
ncbi:hypothetical protein [Salmonirosea aquatica]|uniref:Uncharacterized protein n=1 Tax=Salmonirosea aquatica TaxID=2654236 RepID=A0A7C9BJ52_9BACT|nr:hypothetical protein [Cytophagaceae bacterium SJW1-29]